MSAPVDVLAVMDSTIATRDAMNAGLGGQHCVTNELREARAAVAELIEKGKAIEPMFDNDSPLLTVYRAEIAAFVAALARIGGAA